MTLTTEKRAGTILGQLTSWYNIGTLVAMGIVFLVFQFNLLDFRAMFVICGVAAFVGAVAVYGFPNMVDGKPMARPQQREPIVLRREYGYYYALNLLDGGRQQIFFSFGLWVLVSHYGLGVPQISAVLIATTILNIFFGRWIGKQVDLHGEKPILMYANVGYVVALAGYALIDNVYVAVLCYVMYTMIFPLSGIGASTYLRKVAVQSEIAPSLAMGITLQHVAAIVVPLATGYVLNFVGYQVPFLIACIFACFTFVVTRRLAPEQQRSPRRIAEDAQAVAGIP
jgi:MFS family permease